MREEIFSVSRNTGEHVTLPMTWVHSLVIGSGASGLNAAVQLYANGVEDVLVVTEGVHMGTSINTGSDKQTYYKLSLCGDNPDSPGMMAEAYYSGGSMHGDLALVEASLSARAFFNLVNLGVPFPRDEYGQFVGYQTDHDPRQRATSIGPYTSRAMCRILIDQVKRLHIPVRENRNVIGLLTIGEDEKKRIGGAIALKDDGSLDVYGAENVIFAVGGPGGLYKASVYPKVHTGAIGLALMAGAKAQSLPESQYGMSSIKFRWNVSGTYMQVIPRFISTDADGIGDEQEFLRDYFYSAGLMNSNVFLKGYQWPFDPQKVEKGSSIIDILVYIETVIKGRRVFLDFRCNPEGFKINEINQEALNYLKNSKALQDTPLERLRQMNPDAIKLYKEQGIDISMEPLEIAVCAQHNNGGLAGNHWWESINIKHLFPIGEVNGSHGVYRPGGAALNSGQVGAIRAAEFIANRYKGWDVSEELVRGSAAIAVSDLMNWIKQCKNSEHSWQAEREEFQERMTRVGAHIRSRDELRKAVPEAWEQWKRLCEFGCGYSDDVSLLEALRNRHLCFAHAVYLEAILYALESGVGSRGSAAVLEKGGTEIHSKLGEEWRIETENIDFREKVLETLTDIDGKVENEWVDRRPLPKTDTWFETAWARFLKGDIFE